MFFSAKKLAASHMSMVLVIAMFSATMAESISCSNYDGQRGLCEKQEGVCHWGRRQNKCLSIPTQEECVEKTKRLQCRKFGCVWNDDDGICISTLALFVHEAPQRLKPTIDEDQERSLNQEYAQTHPLNINEENRRFLPDLDNEELAHPLIVDEDEEGEYDGEEEVSFDLFEDEELDERVKKHVDEDGGVYEIFQDENLSRPIIIDEDGDEKVKKHVDEDGGVYDLFQDENLSRPIIIDEDGDERERRQGVTHLDRDVVRDGNGIPNSEEAFWGRMRGEEVRVAKTEIGAEFGDKYKVVICRKRRPRAECLKRNLDYSRVKIWVRKQTKVRKIQIG